MPKTWWSSENPRNSPEKLLELITELNTITGYKTKAEKLNVFQHASNQHMATLFNNTASFTIPKDKIFRHKLNKTYIEPVCWKLQKIDERNHIRPNRSGSWLGRLNTVRMLILSKLILKFNTIITKTPGRYFFVDIDKLILKFIWKGIKVTNTLLKNKLKWEDSLCLICRVT